MSAIEKLQKMREEIDGLKATLEKLTIMRNETLEKHAKEIELADHELDLITMKIESKIEAVELAQGVEEEKDLELEEREEELEDMRKAFLSMRDAVRGACIDAGCDVPEDVDKLGITLGVKPEPPKAEESPPILHSQA